MIDPNNLSDDQLSQLAAQKLAEKQASGSLTHSDLSDDDLNNLAAQKLAEKGQVQIESKQTQPQSSASEAALQHFGNAASFGYLPQVQAATEPLVQGVMDKFLPADPQGFNIKNAPDQSYLQRRDQYIQQQNQMSKDHPVASTLGTIGGALAGGIATGGALSKAVGAGVGLVAPEMGAQIANGVRAGTVGQRLGNAAAVGGGLGLVVNPGDTQGEVSPVQPLQRLKNVGINAVLGGVIQGGGEALGKMGDALKSAPETLQNYSQLKALKASGAMLKDFRKAFGNSRANELGQSAIDEGIIGVGDDIHAIAQKANVVKQEIGSNLSDIYDKADSVLSKASGNRPQGSLVAPGTQLPPENGFDLKSMAEKLKQNIADKYKGMAGGTAIADKMNGILDEIGTNENVSFSKMRDIRQSVDELINYSKSNNDMSQIQSELRTLRNDLQSQVKGGLKTLDENNGTNFLDQFNTQNKRYSNIAELSKIATDKSARVNSNSAFGLREQIGTGAGGAIGATVGGPIGAAIGSLSGAAIAKVSKNYGTPFVALTANKIANALESNPEALGVFSGPLIKAAANSSKDFVTSVGILMKRPEFKQAIDSIKGQDLNLSPSFSESDKAPINRSPSTTKFIRSNQ